MKKIASALLLCSLLVPIFLVASAHAETYTIVLLDPISNRNVFYGGSVIDVKFKLLDSAGNLVTDATARLWIGNTNTQAMGRGQFNTDNFFAIKNQNYVFKLDTRPLPAGVGSNPTTLIITVTVGQTQVPPLTLSPISLH